MKVQLDDKTKQTYIHALAGCIRDSQRKHQIPGWFKTVINEGAWIEWKNELGREVKPKDFKEFVETKYPSGIGTNIETLREYLKEDPEALEIFESLITAKPGGGMNQYTKCLDNNVIEAKQGNSAGYTVRRLKKERPDLFRKVCEKRLSPNKAAIEAGFRTRKIQIDPTVEGFEKSIKKNLTKKQIEKLIYNLS